MKTSDFYYDLPPELIAQTPLEKRDESRLLCLDKATGEWSHHHFYELPDFLRAGDCLILNNSRVLPARLLGRRLPGGGACEVLLLQDKGDKVWECLVRPGKHLREGARVSFGDGELTAEIAENLTYCGDEYAVRQLVSILIDNAIKYAVPNTPIAVSLEKTRKGVGVGYVTLHVGLGTFRPVKEDEIEQHDMHSEYCTIPQETADLINRTKANGGRVICVGTTSCRTIESWAGEDGTMTATGGWTNIYIYPGYRFKVMDGLVTNFHLPESTLIMLVSALYGYEKTMAAYKVAVEERYRFFSFGDAMLIL